MSMTQQPGRTLTVARRADAGTVRLADRDITGLILAAEQYGAQYDLLAAALNAATAYAQLRTAWGRSEAYADLTADEPYVPVRAPALPARPGTGIIRTVRLVPACIRHGRPVRLLLRAIIAALLSLLVLHLIPGQPSGPAAVTGLITWFALTARADLVLHGRSG